jgi:hypothetical protein
MLGAYLTMLPRLRAEESVRSVTEQQLASGSMDRDDAEDIWDAWQESIYPGAREESDPFWF